MTLFNAFCLFRSFLQCTQRNCFLQNIFFRLFPLILLCRPFLQSDLLKSPIFFITTSVSNFLNLKIMIHKILISYLFHKNLIIQKIKENLILLYFSLFYNLHKIKITELHLYYINKIFLQYLFNKYIPLILTFA